MVFANVINDDIGDFERWFDGSVVTNLSGMPRVMYHGTATEFDKFEAPAFFTAVREVAEEYADLRSNDAGSDTYRTVKEVLLSIRKPATENEIRAAAASIGLKDEMVFALIDPKQNKGLPRAVIGILLSEGYDGAIVEDFDFSGNPFDAYVVFDALQVKNITDMPQKVDFLKAENKRRKSI